MKKQQTAERLRERQREYYQRNRAKKIEAVKQYQRLNAEKFQQYQREYQQTYQAKYRELNPEKIAGYRRTNAERLKLLNRQYRQNNPEKVNSYSREWQRKNPEKSSRYQRKSQLKKKYGIPLEMFDQMFAKQNGVCAICFDAKAEFVDHDHITNRIRELLCHHCNSALGFARDSQQVLLNAVAYLQKHSQ